MVRTKENGPDCRGSIRFSSDRDGDVVFVLYTIGPLAWHSRYYFGDLGIFNAVYSRNPIAYDSIFLRLRSTELLLCQSQ